MSLFSRLASAPSRLLQGPAPAPGGARDTHPPPPSSPSPEPSGALTAEELRLAEAAGVAPDVALALRRLGGGLQRLVGLDGDTFAPAERPGLSTPVPSARSVDAVVRLRDAVGPGYAPFRCEQNFGRGDDLVAVLRADDPFAPLHAMGTNGANFDLDTADIVAKLRAWDARFGLRLLGAGMDWAEAEFVRQPEDMAAFSEEVYAFCPDVVDQGTQSVQALEEEMTIGNVLYLWWD